MDKTIEDILAQMRKPSIYKGKIPVSRVDADFKYFADKLESAIAQKPQHCGNTAKMREALEAVVKVGYPHNFQHEAPHISGYCYEITAAIKQCFAALAEPARNCDVGTAEEQEERYIKLKRAHIDRLTYCPAQGQSWFPDSLYWAQMPYEEEANNDE